MDIRIQALHFEATVQLKEFIHKKLEKLNRFADDIQGAEVILKVTKRLGPEGDFLWLASRA